MPHPNIKPTHKPIKNYYAELKEYDSIGANHEGAVRTAFQNLLQHYCRQADLILVCEKTRSFPLDKGGQGGSGPTDPNRRIRPDGEIVDTFGLPYGYWEAKDTHDDLHIEAGKKFAAGYPSKNIVVQSPTHALLYQHGQLQLDLDITEPRNLVNVLQTFFAYQEENISAWHIAVSEFKETVPELGEKLATLIETERQDNPQFQKAFANFHQQCQTSINPNLSIAAVEEMLIQHLLTERIFRTVFNNRDFTRRNIIAREIENVIDALTSQTFDRNQFLQSLDPFYVAIEQTAATITEFRSHYKDNTITKWDIFHYTYGLLHHPTYREKYEANLKRDLPHIPFANDFWGFVKAGEQLADLHINYESQPEYDKLKFVQNPDTPLNWRVEKMKLSKDKTQIVYNDFLTLDGIPEKAFDYRLGNRSALEWIINQHCVKIDKRSGIVNDPNRADDPQYIVKLIGKVITVSLETTKIVEVLPDLYHKGDL